MYRCVGKEACARATDRIIYNQMVVDCVLPEDEIDRIFGALADSIGYGPLFGALGAFDLIGATLLVILMRGVSRDAPARQPASGARPAA